MEEVLNEDKKEVIPLLIGEGKESKNIPSNLFLTSEMIDSMKVADIKIELATRNLSRNLL